MLWALATPTMGFWKSASPKPTARSIERLGARSSPSVMARLRRRVVMSFPPDAAHLNPTVLPSGHAGGRVAKVKGTAVQSSLRYVRERFGEDPLARVIEALPEGDRAAFGHGVLASSWYGMDAFLRFMQEAERQLRAQEPDVVRKMGRASCDYGVTGVYKIFFKVGSPGVHHLAGRPGSSRATTTRASCGSRRPARSGRWPSSSGLEGGAPQFCERIFGWMQRTLELAGAKNLRSAHSACVHRGDPVCRFEGSWG